MKTETVRFDYDPNSVLDYSIDWSQWLADGETIQTSTWEVDTDIQDANESITDGSVCTVWLGPGGEPGERYWVTNRITTDQGRTDDRSIVLIARHR